MFTFTFFFTYLSPHLSRIFTLVNILCLYYNPGTPILTTLYISSAVGHNRTRAYCTVFVGTPSKITKQYTTYYTIYMINT